MSFLVERRYPLILHPTQSSDFNEWLNQFDLHAEVQFLENTLQFKYEWRGDSSSILFPELSPLSQRKDFLWEHTCFEAFWGWEGESSYWELNTSPSGDWNIYYFDDYRMGQKSEERLVQVQFERHTHSLIVRVDLSRILNSNTMPLRVGLTAVIELKSGQKTYWAIAHGADRPDFHLRNSFIIQI